jgi:hypothetical protein
MIPLSHLPPGIIPPFPPPPSMMPPHPLPPDLVPLFPSGCVASLVSVDTILDTSDGMQGVQNSHPQLQTRAESHSPPVLLRQSRASWLPFPTSLTTPGPPPRPRPRWARTYSTPHSSLCITMHDVPPTIPSAELVFSLEQRDEGSQAL